MVLGLGQAILIKLGSLKRRSQTRTLIHQVLRLHHLRIQLVVREMPQMPVALVVKEVEGVWNLCFLGVIQKKNGLQFYDLFRSSWHSFSLETHR